ncbi:pentatricopeptide repeat-containing protein At3g57430, chloroplastic-like [Salvia hispanica]|uniref:pentatricopeptide repeat-containing protein At3g57430, chloroplastic-like n=1 Tax=Salvia hispanica TaxID=49212 RepID=UPI002008FDCD|nr:pentatricopeptide repeat-containing protein At3g57430, chloroplastic-like [Salvia hispanica]
MNSISQASNSWRQNVLKIHLAYYSTQKMSHASTLQKIRDIRPLHQAHAHIIVSNLSGNVFLCNRLMNAYASCGFVSISQIIFSQITDKNLVSWTILLSGLTKNDRFFEAAEVFNEMMVLKIRPNERTIATVLPAFGKLGRVLLGKSVHCYWIRRNFGGNVFVETGLVDMYSKFGCTRIARNVFDNMSVRNVVSWNAIISGYSSNGYGGEALQMFIWMKRNGLPWDIFTVMSLISLEDFRVGTGIHSLVVRSGYENDPLIRTALMGLYINGNFVDDAYRIFEEIGKKDLVAWTSMLRGFLKSGNWRRTVEHFKKMMGEDKIALDYVSLITMLSGCSCFGALEQGRRMHGLVLKTGLQDDLFVGSAVIDMYANCASMIDAKRYFGGMVEKDVACWNTLISGYGMIGCGNEAIDTFLKMKGSGLSPDESTLVSVLCACSHAGLVEKGLRIFDQMTKVWNLSPNLKHYACVVDLLGRSGRINDAYSLTKSMHLQPGLEIYSSLLTACKIHRNFELGDEIAQKLVELKPNDAGQYILLSNVYALAGNWDCARLSRVSLKSNNLKKNPGLSYMEINGEMFIFMARQRDHPHYLEIRDFLQGLILKIKAAGYEPDTDSVLLDVSDDVKRDILFHHSEKLAIAFGLMRTKPGSVVRITKNLRICDDCHLASKFVSKVYARVLIIKDANRFHVFRDGICSCRDWW